MGTVSGSSGFYPYVEMCKDLAVADEMDPASNEFNSTALLRGLSRATNNALQNMGDYECLHNTSYATANGVSMQGREELPLCGGIDNETSLDDKGNSIIGLVYAPKWSPRSLITTSPI